MKWIILYVVEKKIIRMFCWLCIDICIILNRAKTQEIKHVSFLSDDLNSLTCHVSISIWYFEESHSINFMLNVLWTMSREIRSNRQNPAEGSVVVPKRSSGKAEKAGETRWHISQPTTMTSICLVCLAWSGHQLLFNFFFK